MNSKLFYKGMSKIYDLLDIFYFRNYNRSPRKAMSDFIDSDDLTILDLCTGTGSNTVHIAVQHKDADIIGIDISKEMLAIANKKVKSSGFRNIHFKKMDATKTDFDDHSFDVVTISLVLHEISEELRKSILSEVKRIVKPDGKILVIEWEQPRSIGKRIMFFPIKKLEPKGFKQFLKMNANVYFTKYGLEIYKVKHCDYSIVYYLKVI